MIGILFLVLQLAKFAAGAATLVLLVLAGLCLMVGQWALAIVLLVLAAATGFVAFKLCQDA